MPEDPRFFLFAIPAVILIGLGKGGFSGLGALGTPLIALGIDPVRGAAILLPILIVQDVVGVIAYRLWVERGHVVQASSTSPGWVGTLFGALSGFTSQIAHAGGPPFQMWVMPRRLPRDIFVGTSALFFAIVNWIKVPAYLALGQFSTANLTASLMLLPLAILSSLAGVWLVRRVVPERFYTIVYILMIVAGAKLLFDGVTPA